jgi:hypothetical protein
MGSNRNSNSHTEAAQHLKIHFAPEPSHLRHKKFMEKAYASIYSATFIRFYIISSLTVKSNKILPESVRKVNDASSGAHSSCLKNH